MTVARELAEAPFSSRRGLFGGLIVAALILGVLVVVDVLPRIDAPPPAVQGRRFLPQDLGPVEAIEIERGGKVFRLDRVSSGWEILDHGERSAVVDDRVTEFLDTVGSLVELVEIGPASAVSLEEFGLSEPEDRIVLIPGSGKEIQILLGDRNPPLTGIYVEVLPGERVVLVGAVLLLEVDKLAALASSQAP